MKIIHPSGNATPEELEILLKYSIEGRKRVKDQIMRFDTTFPDVKFFYNSSSGNTFYVKTLEEEIYPNLYYISSEFKGEENVSSELPLVNISVYPTLEQLKETHKSFREEQKGITYKQLFGSYLKNSRKITLTDPYIKYFYQIRNFMEFVEVLLDIKEEGDELELNLLTTKEEQINTSQDENFQKIKSSIEPEGIIFTWEFDTTNTIHARHIVSDNGWKISLDRGLDIFQRNESNDTFLLSNRQQKFRKCKAFEITYIRI
jgi:ATP-dependent Lon protease